VNRFTKLLQLVAVALVTLISNSNALADRHDQPAPLPGWTHDVALTDDTLEQHGISLNGRQPMNGSTVAAEIDGNLANGLEVVFGGTDGMLHAYRSDGSLLWTHNLPNFNCKATKNNNKLYSTPAVGAIYGDGIPYVVSSFGGIGASKCDGGIVVIRGYDGFKMWDFTLKKFGKKYGGKPNGVISSPAIADTDGDGTMEIGFGSLDRKVYILNNNGSLRRYYSAADTVWSSAAFVNVDSDPNLEMIMGTDISGNKALRPPTQDGGYLYAFKTNATKKKLYRFRDEEAYVWQTAFDQVIFSAPVIADVMPENPGDEIIIGSGCYFPSRSNAKRGKWFKILRASDGQVLQTLNAPACSPSSVAVGDIDDDGVLEIIAAVNGNARAGGDGNSRLMAWKASNSEPLWSIVPKSRGKNDSWGGEFMSPVVADLDANGSLEVILTNGTAVGIFNGRDGTPLTCQEAVCTDTQLMLYMWTTTRATPAVADVNNDGELDIVIGAGRAYNNGKGMLYGWTGFSDLLGSPSGMQIPGSVPWPMYRGNAQHTGVYGE